MIGLVETVERRAVDAEQRRLPVGLIEPVEIDQQAHDAIAEAMAHRLQPRMHHLAEIKRGRGVVRSLSVAAAWSGIATPRPRASSGGGCAPRRRRAQRFGHREAGAQAVLVKTVSGPGAAEPGVALALNFAQALLGGKGGGIILRMLAHVFAEGQAGSGSNGGLRLTNSGLSSSMPCSRFIQ